MAYRERADQQRAAHEHYLANKAKVIERTAAVRAAIAAHILDAKSVPCADCGRRFPSVAMDFDHLRDKAGDISRYREYGWSLARVVVEMEKCEVVCACCHRIRTADRLGSVGPGGPAGP